ncbi:hypothetical protein [Sinobaca sp. H24]
MESFTEEEHGEVKEIIQSLVKKEFRKLITKDKIRRTAVHPMKSVL